MDDLSPYFISINELARCGSLFICAQHPSSGLMYQIGCKTTSANIYCDVSGTSSKRVIITNVVNASQVHSYLRVLLVKSRLLSSLIYNIIFLNHVTL